MHIYIFIYISKFYRVNSEITSFSNTINFKWKNLVFDSMRIGRNLISTYIFRKDQTVTEKKFESMPMFNLKVANDISSRWNSFFIFTFFLEIQAIYTILFYHFKQRRTKFSNLPSYILFFYFWLMWNCYVQSTKTKITSRLLTQKQVKIQEKIRFRNEKHGKCDAISKKLFWC